MALAWQSVSEGLEHGGYAAWEAAAEQARGGAMLVPVMAKLVPPDGGGMDLAGAIDATLALGGVEFSRHERDLLKSDRVRVGAGWPYEVRFVAYAPRSLLAAVPPYWQVLGVGPGFAAAELAPDAEPARDLASLPGPLAEGQPVVGIIDDGIGFLNARFRAGAQKTRFLGVWLQASERLAQGAVGPRGDIRLGRVLTGTEIDRHLDTHAPEAEVYSSVNRALYPLPDRAATARRVGHGSHVLDIACGASFDEPMAAAPILAVQLPPASMRETAGRRTEAHLVQGLRWILAEVLRLSDKNKAPPVVINLSIGSLAGPGDATEFLADWMAYEIDRHRRLAPKGEVRITGAYGNARLNRLSARAELRIRRPLALDWRILPDDRTASFLELRVDAPKTGGVSVRLTPPTGSGLPMLEVDWPQEQGGWRLDAEGGKGPLAAATFRTEEGSGQALLHLALAPTQPDQGLARVAPGLWRLELATAHSEPIRVIARVQRDDTPFGHAPYGRQSWLDHPEGWTWDSYARSYTNPQPLVDGAPQCPVTREGTAVSFAGADRDEIYLVGALRQPGDVQAARPSVFSSEGADHLVRAGESIGPTLAAAGEVGGFLGGIRATALLTGSQVRLSGTSMAAPAVARRLVDYFRTTRPEDRSTAAERAALVGEGQWDDETDPRTGHGLLQSA